MWSKRFGVLPLLCVGINWGVSWLRASVFTLLLGERVWFVRIIQQKENLHPGPYLRRNTGSVLWFFDCTHPLYSLFEGNGYGLSASFRKKTPPRPCLVRDTRSVLYLFAFTFLYETTLPWNISIKSLYFSYWSLLDCKWSFKDYKWSLWNCKY